MKNNSFQRVICFVLSVTLLLGMFGFGVSAYGEKDPKPGETDPYEATSLSDMSALVNVATYDEYLLRNNDFKVYYEAAAAEAANKGETLAVIDCFESFIAQMNDGKGQQLQTIVVHADGNPGYITADSNYEFVKDSEACKSSFNLNRSDWDAFGSSVEDFESMVANSSAVYISDEGSVSWKVNISSEQVGFYYIKIEYFTCNTDTSSISSIERKLKIDGAIPFSEVSSIDLNKNWVYSNIEVSAPVATDKADGYYVSYSEADEKSGYKKFVSVVENGYETVTTYTIENDINLNSMSPEMTSVPTWNTYYVSDASGYYDGNLAFYMEYGDREITLEAIREPMIIKSIELVPVGGESDAVRYEEYLAQFADKQTVAKKPDGSPAQSIRIEAEFPDMVSDSSVSPTNDNTSAINSPILPNAQVFNVIGENSYSAVGQWAAYKFRVDASGFYNIGMRYKQSALQGMFVCRTVKISGGDYGENPVVPFQEAYNAEFDYDKNWQSKYIGMRGEDPFLFYFEAGVEYTLYLECSLGTLKSYIKRVEASLEIINSCYLQILQLTGTDPDEHTDYMFMDTIPEVIVALLEQAKELMDVKNDLEALCGTNGSHIATLETVAILLNTMGADRGEEIPKNMETLKSYLGTLGTWINNSKRSSISVDQIWVTPAKEDGANAVADNDQLPEANANFFQSLWFEIKSFFCSFFVEYDQMGLTVIPDENTLTIDVWLATGRDQSQIWRTMIDAGTGFTSNTGTAVSLKLVTAGTLLPSILSGKGPDVYMGLGSADVINYAIRNAVLGVSGNANLTDEQNAVFSSYNYTYKYTDEDGNSTYETTTTPKDGETPTFISKPYNYVIEDDGDLNNENEGDDELDRNFSKAAMDTITLLDVTYGLPQTMGFAMMFYRMDVLANLKINVPETWDDLLAILPVLQSNNMSIGVAYISALDFMIYQKGGSMWKYTDQYDPKYAGAKIDLDSKIALEAFQFTCKLYTDYSFPVSYDAANRFRTGEMPIIIGDYASIYNQLVVYATEIEGMWEFCSLPGSEKQDKDGNVVGFSYDSLAGIGATVILYGAEKDTNGNGKYDELLASWQFLQWQTGHEAQADYGNRMVALIGPSAKYETANLKAIDDLSWTASEKKAIKNQMAHLSSIVNYPGSYICGRYMQFAFLDVVNESADPIDSMTSYIDAINTELTRKRKEFGDQLWYVGKDDMIEPPMLQQSTTD